MKTKDEILMDIERLKEESPENTMETFAPLEAAVEQYFKSDADLEYNVRECTYQVALNHEYRNTIFVHQEYMPKFKSNFPKGYEDVRDLFDGGEVWEEIEEIDIETFVDAFHFPEAAGEASESDTGDAGGEEGGEEEPITNPYLDDWAARVEASRAAIVPGLEAIIAFCESNATNNGLAVYFEEHGGIKSAPKRRETAKRIYIDGGYAEVIRTYGLDVHIPSYYRE